MLPPQRFPKPDFESGYTYPEQTVEMARGLLGEYADLAVLFLLLCITSWLVLRRRSRKGIVGVSIFSVVYFGFIKKGCICSVGSIQNVAIAIADSSYVLPISVLITFFLPIIFALLFGRVFCAGVCPLGAIQDLVHIKNHKLSPSITKFLSLLPWIYLSFAILFAVMGTDFIICKYDPFVGLFRLSGEFEIIIFGILLLIGAMFTGKPYCRFLCPYGPILKVVSRFSFHHTKITKQTCINCQLCSNACPFDAIHPPTENKVKEPRRKGVQRILLFTALIPLLMFVGYQVGTALAPTLAQTHRKVQLLEQVDLFNAGKIAEESAEIEAFFALGLSIDALRNDVELIQKDFTRGSQLLMAFIALIIGTTLLKLSIKRKRETYEIDKADCMSCGRCYSYCPVNKNSTTKPSTASVHDKN